MKKEVMIVTGAGQIGMAIARRVGFGKKIILGDKSMKNAETIAKIMNDAGYDVEPFEMDRLTFAQLLLSCVDEYNKQKQEGDFSPIEIKQIELRSKPLGEPVNPKYRGATSMKNALNLMKQKEVVELKRMIKSGDYENLDKGIQSLCSDFRKIIEQGIETDLLQKIVTRFGYSVNSLRLRYLYEITKEDIDKFDNMMTKYSAFEHSQSTERPINLPEVSEIETDIDDMLNWCKNFKKKCENADKKK